VNEMNVAIRAEPPFVDLSSLRNRPHLQLAAMQERGPIVQYADGQYLIVGGRQVIALLGDRRVRQIRGLEFLASAQIPDSLTAQFVTGVLPLASDAPPYHQHRFIAHALSRPVLRALRPHLRRVANQVVADLPRRAVFEFGPPMAARIPPEMMVAFLGLPARDVPRLAPYIFDAARAFSPVYPNTRHNEIEAATHALFDYLFAQVSLRRSAPSDDLLSAIVAEWATTPQIPLERLIFQIMGLLVTGAEALRCALVMLTAQLLQRPLIWSMMRNQGGLVSGAVAESLRFEPPVASVTRRVDRAIEMGGIVLPKGSVLRLSMMAALRDPALCANPNRFDPKRADQPVIPHCFGVGTHAAFAAYLAPMMLAESLAALLDAVPQLELISQPRIVGCYGTRQVTPMHVFIP